MRIYSIFDDFDAKAAETIRDTGITLEIHPLGVPRPDAVQMKHILEKYDGVIIGTTQKISEDMFENINSPRIIATASVGLDHIQIPEEKKGLVTVFNTPKANAQSVAEYTIGCALTCCKRLTEGRKLYAAGKDNKKLSKKPEDLFGRTIGVVGAGNISRRIMEYAAFFGMKVLCWTAHPEIHPEIAEMGVQFAELNQLLSSSDVISVNLPNTASTVNIISQDRIAKMKSETIFISVSRKESIDWKALLEKASQNPTFYVCLDLDVYTEIVSDLPDIPNVLVTPHIAGGTIETRKRMFRELAERIGKEVHA